MSSAGKWIQSLSYTVSAESKVMELVHNCLASIPASIDHKENACHLCLIHVQLTSMWCKTTSGENFVLASDEDDKIVSFGTENEPQHLFEADTFDMDGTFSVCPSIFYQVFTIHVMKYNQVFPMIYALLPNIKGTPTTNCENMLLERCWSWRRTNPSPHLYHARFRVEDFIA